MGKKYEFTGKEMLYPVKVKEIRALRDFGYVKKGDIGGYIESEKCLSQKGNCWVYPGAVVYGNSLIGGNAVVAEGVTVRNKSVVSGNAFVVGKGIEISHSIIEDNVVIDTGATIENSLINGNASIEQSNIESAKIDGNVHIMLSRLIGVNNGKGEPDNSYVIGMVDIYHSELTGHFNIEGKGNLCTLEQVKAESLVLEKGGFGLTGFKPVPNTWVSGDFYYNHKTHKDYGGFSYFMKQFGERQEDTLFVWEDAQYHYSLTYFAENPELCIKLNPSYSLEELLEQLSVTRSTIEGLQKSAKGDGLTFCEESLKRVSNAEEGIREILEKNPELQTERTVCIDPKHPATPYIIYERKGKEPVVEHRRSLYGLRELSNAYPEGYDFVEKTLKRKEEKTKE